jgi:hypothetical protein
MGSKRHYTQPFNERFWLKVGLARPDDCWPWMRGINNKGYGFACNEHGRGHREYAHRIAWRLFNKSDIPAGLWVLHECDNPPCCNPRHLRLGTLQDNVDDSWAKGRTARGEKNHSSKLTEHDVREMRRLRREGLTYQAIAARFNMSMMSTYYACNGVTWRHVVDEPGILAGLNGNRATLPTVPYIVETEKVSR